MSETSDLIARLTEAFADWVDLRDSKNAELCHDAVACITSLADALASQEARIAELERERVEASNKAWEAAVGRQTVALASKMTRSLMLPLSLLLN